MARPRKDCVEGGVAPSVVNDALRVSMARTETVKVDLAARDNQKHAHMLGAGFEWFKAQFPDDWEALRLCPLQHGMDTMIEKLNA